MQARPNLLFRNDTILGVCEALGQDFGFHANWLRLLFGSLFYFAPVAVVGTYLALGVVVAVTRWTAPDEIVPAAAPERPESEAAALPMAA